jgi:hypothetical protein
MGKKTRLWYVSLRLEPPQRSSWHDLVYNCCVVVVVTDRNPGPHRSFQGGAIVRDVVPIRSITPTAAARQYIRHNLARRLETIFVGPGTDGWDGDLVEHYRSKTPVIRVVKKTR